MPRALRLALLVTASLSLAEPVLARPTLTAASRTPRRTVTRVASLAWGMAWVPPQVFADAASIVTHNVLGRTKDRHGVPVPPLYRPDQVLWRLSHGTLDRVARAMLPALAFEPLTRAQLDTIDRANASFLLRTPAAWRRDPASFHVAPPPLRPLSDRLVGELPGGRQRIDLDFLSDYRPPRAIDGGELPGSARYRSYGFARARVRLTLAPPPPGRRGRERRDLIIFAHGVTMGSAHDLGPYISGVEAIASGLGANAAMVAAPFHGVRRRGLPGRGIVSMAAEDHLNGMAQYVSDIRQLIAWYRARNPDARIGVYGMSLGGYAVRTLAALEPDLEAVIASVPADDPIARMGELQLGARPSPAQVARARRVVAPVASERLRAVVPVARRFVYGESGDQVIGARTAVFQARQWDVLGRPDQVAWGHGGHNSSLFSARGQIQTWLRGVGFGARTPAARRRAAGP